MKTRFVENDVEFLSSIGIAPGIAPLPAPAKPAGPSGGERLRRYMDAARATMPTTHILHPDSDDGGRGRCVRYEPTADREAVDVWFNLNMEATPKAGDVIAYETEECMFFARVGRSGIASTGALTVWPTHPNWPTQTTPDAIGMQPTVLPSNYKDLRAVSLKRGYVKVWGVVTDVSSSLGDDEEEEGGEE